MDDDGFVNILRVPIYMEDVEVLTSSQLQQLIQKKANEIKIVDDVFIPNGYYLELLVRIKPKLQSLKGEKDVEVE